MVFNMKENRFLSFLIIGIIYVIASAVGIICFNLLKFDLWLNLLIADVVATIFVFIFSCIFHNASVYDPYWSVQPIVIVVAFAFISKLTPIKLIVVLAILYWGIRLTSNWAYTFKNLSEEDWRYKMLKEKNGKLYPIINFLGIHLMPTLIVYLVTLPAVYIICYTVATNLLSILFALLSITATTIQMVADYQMHKYRKNATSEKIFTGGLWNYSRHPNYLGEVLMWWGIGLCAISLFGVNYMFLLSGAIINTLLFEFISIPLAENKLNERLGFDEYKARTHRLLLLPNKRT